MKKIFTALRKQKGSLTGLLAFLIPFGLTALFLILFGKKIYLSLKGFLGGFGNAWNDEGEVADKTAVAEQMQADAKKIGITITNFHKQLADQIHTQLNGVDSGLSFWALTNNTVDDAQENALAKYLFANVKTVPDMAALYLAYGVRKLKNRQAKILGFIWDDTAGTLSDHVERYLDCKNEFTYTNPQFGFYNYPYTPKALFRLYIQCANDEYLKKL